jgi:hypothetical protein
MSLHSLRLRLTTLFLGLSTLGACGSELTVASSPAGSTSVTGTIVRTRPFCGNGLVETGEHCDDGADGDDSNGCTDRCKAPCEGAASELASCGPGRRIPFSVTGTHVQTGRNVRADYIATTLACTTVDGMTEEFALCTEVEGDDEPTCLDVVPPSTEDTVCAAPCDDASDCSAGETCVLGVDPATSEYVLIGGRCLPTIGGAVDDACTSGANCGVGLACVGVIGEEMYVCVPATANCDRDECPASHFCAPAFDTLTGRQAGNRCFALAEACRSGAPSFRPASEICRRGCSALDGCGFEYTPEPGCETGCDCESACLERGGNRLILACLLEDGCSALTDGLHPIGSQGAGSGSSCQADIDSTCTFGSECDPDCRRADGCGDVSAAGTCRGERLQYCLDRRVTTVDCAALGRACGYDPEARRFDCLAGVP